MVTLRLTGLHWIEGEKDDPTDLCAHSRVEFRVGNDTLVSPEIGDWTVSASALYLLRTLSKPHKKDGPVGDHLFPCCGFSMYEVEGQDDVAILGCPNGVDIEVRHEAEEVVLAVSDGREYRILFSEWSDAVCAFSDEVRSFYVASLPKRPAGEEEAKGYRKFLAEWDRRREQANRPS